MPPRRPTAKSATTTAPATRRSARTKAALPVASSPEPQVPIVIPSSSSPVMIKTPKKLMIRIKKPLLAPSPTTRGTMLSSFSSPTPVTASRATIKIVTPKEVAQPPPIVQLLPVKELSPFEVDELEATQPHASGSSSPPRAVAAVPSKSPRQLSRFEIEEQQFEQRAMARTATSPTPTSKGKEPAVVLDDSDDEDEDIFDLSKRAAPIIRPATQQLFSGPSKKRLLFATSSDSDDSDEDGLHRKKKKPSPMNALKKPAWKLRESTERGSSAGRGRTDSQSVMATPPPSDLKGETGKRAISLTPPPEIDTEQFEAARLRIKAHLAKTIQDEDEEPDLNSNAVTLPPQYNPSPAKGRVITISLRMVADPERQKNPAMARALKDYGKLRTFKFGLRSPLSKLISVLADRLQKKKSDLVLTYQGQKIASDLLTPQQLGIEDDCTMEGYEKVVYETIVEEKRRTAQVRLARLTQAESEGEEEDDDDEEAGDGKESEPEAPAVSDGLFRLIMRDAEGKEVSAKVKSVSLCENLVLHFCKKAGLPDSAAKSMRVFVDGEKMEPEQTIGEADLEDGDMVDIRQV